MAVFPHSHRVRKTNEPFGRRLGTTPFSVAAGPALVAGLSSSFAHGPCHLPRLRFLVRCLASPLPTAQTRPTSNALTRRSATGLGSTRAWGGGLTNPATGGRALLAPAWRRGGFTTTRLRSQRRLFSSCGIVARCGPVPPRKLQLIAAPRDRTCIISNPPHAGASLPLARGGALILIEAATCDGQDKSDLH